MKETKVYLNTIEELTKALSEGKTVYDDKIGSKCCTRRHKMINGIVIEEYEEESGNYTYINDTFRFDEKCFYIIEKPALKIEVGKFYKNKEGDKCICVYESTDKKYKNRFLMIIIGALPESNRYCVDEEGKTDYEENPYDIVDYWEEK